MGFLPVLSEERAPRLRHRPRLASGSCAENFRYSAGIYRGTREEALRFALNRIQPPLGLSHTRARSRMWSPTQPTTVFAMIEKPRIAAFVACGVVLVLLAGCASSSPEMDRAETALEGGEYGTALSSIEQALERDSSNTDAYLLKADVLRQRADSSMDPDVYADLFRRATAAEEKALEFEPDLRSEIERERRRVYDREIGRGERAYNYANKHDQSDLFPRAIGFFAAAAATQPDSARPALNEAYARLQVGQRKDVIPVLERYVERTDTAAKKAQKILGELYVSDGQYENATRLLDRATELYPGDREIQALRLNAYNQAGDVDEALAVYREQIEKTPTEASYRYNYGALLLKAKRYADAIEQLSAALEHRPENPEGQYNLGAAYLNAALVRDDSIATLEEDPDALRDTTMSVDQRIDRLVQKRQDFFENAIPPLERARRLTEDPYLQLEGKQQLRQNACRALLVAYVQTDRPNRAAQVEDCTGFARTAR